MKHLKIFREHAYDTETDVEVENWEDVDISDAFTKKLVVYNDDVNTFDHVIDTFVKVLDHTPEQAEQNAILIHTKGKAVVKSGSEEELTKYKRALLDAKLTAKIED
jgi:ATP-dependent Clp protease adaptor protein ClpS